MVLVKEKRIGVVGIIVIWDFLHSYDISNRYIEPLASLFKQSHSSRDWVAFSLRDFGTHNQSRVTIPVC